MNSLFRANLLGRTMLAGVSAFAVPVGLVGAAAVMAPGAWAQETAPAATLVSDEGERDVVVVTGSLLQSETASPVTVLSAESLTDRGIVSIADAVSKVSANNAGTIPQGWNAGYNFASGATAVSLRGLTTSSTLTVFDGLRMSPYPFGDDGRRNFVDLNAIPQGIVDRVEVLRDGASSTYGADAIAGVVNVITKKEIQGLHFDGSTGISQEGDAKELNLNFTAGHGDLVTDGFNVYIGGEYSHSDSLRLSDRDYPFNTADWSQICGPSGSCLPNQNRSGISADGTFGFGNTTVPFVRPYVGGAATGVYELADPANGCRDLIAHTLTDAQQRDSNGNLLYAPLQCEQNRVGTYAFAQPDVIRGGLAGRVTFDLNDNTEVYARADWYQVKTRGGTTPYGFNGRTAPPGSVTLSPVVLPVYVCSTTIEVCDATNGTLNPNNPYASIGQEAALFEDFIRPRGGTTQADTFRAASGVEGTFGDGWDYKVDATMSHITLDRSYTGYIFLQNLMDVIHDGSYNFIDQSANPTSVLDYVAPETSNRSTSDVYQLQGTVSKDLFELPGGYAKGAFGVSWREEKINNPSANPANALHPTERYYSINAVGAVGSRDVYSAFFEVDAPVLDTVDVNVSGRYDDYSSGQSNFSPKVGVTYTPMDMLSFRGTYSEGFRVASFNEAYGLPTTGYTTRTVDPTTAAGAAFIAAHGGNAYASNGYSVGLTSSGNPGLEPEKSKSFTLGTVYEPTDNIQLTLDYWSIEVNDLITNADYSEVFTQYYENNGMVNVPGITVLPDIADPAFPNALPRLGFIQYSYENANTLEVSGIDASARAHMSIPHGIEWTTSATVSYLDNFEKTFDSGAVESYAGTLSPCDVTSCSGSPEWRWDWQNTFDWNDTSVSLTAYYTAGYDEASVDYGGVKGDCAASIGASVAAYDDGTPSICESDATFFIDMSASHQINDNVKVYLNVLNLLDSDAPFDPGAAYGLYGYNPAWASPGFLGRYFRIGATFDF